MNHYSRIPQIAPGLLITFSMLASLAHAAEPGVVKLQFGSSYSAAQSAAQPDAAVQAITLSPAVTEAPEEKMLTQPAVTPGTLQSLNPQPLPPAGSAIKPIQGTGINQIATTPGALQSLNPQPLPPAGSAIKLIQCTCINQIATTPGALQSLNPQPLPPAGNAVKPLQGAGSQSIDTIRPLINTVTMPLVQPDIRDKMGTPKLAAPVRPGMDERGIIIVGGKPLTVGELNKNLYADIAAKAGTPKTIKSRARKLDFVQPVLQNTLQQNIGANSQSFISARPENLASLSTPGTPKISIDAKAINYSELKCPNQGKGPPKISEIQGKLIPGKRVSIWGECFGDRTGRVEIIGQFSGDKLTPAFASWDQNLIEIEIPANIRSASDHATTLSVITADGKTSTSVKVQFVAARERIEVPAYMWSPGARFELAANENTTMDQNSARAGQTSKNLRINALCALETMDAVVATGGVTEINGWEQGPPNEAAVTLKWVADCSGQTVTTRSPSGFLGLDATFNATAYSVCRVDFQTRAWAYCPVGIAP